MHEFLASQLADPVHVHGMERRSLRERFVAKSVDGSRRREHESAKGNVLQYAQQELGPASVYIQSLLGVGLAVRNVVEGSEMEDDVRLESSDRLEVFGLADISCHHLAIALVRPTNYVQPASDRKVVKDEH